MDSWSRYRALFLCLVSPAAFWLVLFFLAPLALVWLMSFSETRGLVGVELTWTLANYARALDPLYLSILWQSLWLAALTTVACLLLGFPIALLTAFAPPRWKTLLLVAVMLPFWTNLLVRTYALTAMFRTQGFLNFGLEWLWQRIADALAMAGLEGAVGGSFHPLELLYTDAAVLIGLVYVHLPFMVLPLYASLERLDRSYLEASLDLGAGQWRTFFSVTVPLSMPGIASGALLVFIPAIGSFLTPDLLGGPNSQMIGSLIERQFKSANDWPFGSALSLLLMYATFGALALHALFAGRGAEARP